MSSEDLTLYIPSWRLKLLVGFIVVYAAWTAAMELGHISHQLSSINRALRAEFESTRTPPGEKRRLGEYEHHQVTIDTEEGDAE